MTWLTNKTHPGSVEMMFRQQEGKKNLEEWLIRSGLRKHKLHPGCIHALLNTTGKCSKCNRMPPWLDHGELFAGKGSNGAPEVLVGHPYQLSDEDLLELFKLCDTHGLELFISRKLSWYFYGRTYLVMLIKGASVPTSRTGGGIPDPILPKLKSASLVSDEARAGVKSFLQEMCVTSPGYSEDRVALWCAYAKHVYAKYVERPVQACTQKEFYGVLRTMLPETRTNKHRAFGGIRLKAPEE